MQPVELKLISALEKCFTDESTESKKKLHRLSCLKNEKLSFQAAYRCTDPFKFYTYASVRMSGALQPYITVRQVAQVPSSFPADPNGCDENYLRTTAGLYPDALIPLHFAGRVCFGANILASLFFDLQPTDEIKAGTYPLTVGLYGDRDELLAEDALEIEIFEARLPELPIKHTEWFHTDCLASYYHVEAFSDRHFEIIENFIATATQNGINTILTPVFTPELDTYVGGERMTTQLVRIQKKKDGYAFDYALLDRWLEICKKHGVKYFEFPPFYTQWGATAAPKIVAEVNGREERIFGWETDSASPEYVQFLDAFLPSLIAFLKSRGVDKNCLYHISDEPTKDDLEHYGKIAWNVKKHLGDYAVIDALSHTEFCELGILTEPVAVVNEAERFLEAGVKNLWCYYCLFPRVTYTNRFMAMPSARTRILGVQLYRYQIAGFLHWGYNFWNNRFSYDAINPYLETSGEFFAPSGDCFLVYPAQDGTATESLRLISMRDAMQDLRALTLLESLTSREHVLSLINEGLDYELSFDKYPQSAEYLLELREKVNAAIRAAKK